MAKQPTDQTREEFYAAEVDRLRTQVQQTLNRTTKILSQIYQLLGELSAVNVDTATRAMTSPPVPPESHPKRTKARGRATAQTKPRKGNGTPPRAAKPTTSALLKGTTDDTLLTVDQAAAFLGLKKGTLNVYRRRDSGPAYITVDDGGRNPYRYRKVDLAAWAESNRGKSKPQE